VLGVTRPSARPWRAGVGAESALARARAAFTAGCWTCCCTCCCRSSPSSRSHRCT
jgi:hypothetical protein